MKKTTLQLLSLVFAITVLHSCKSNPPAVEVPGEFANGVFITEQGAFQTGTGTISFLNTTTNKITNDVFGVKNGFALGNILQSMNVINGTGFLVVNNANKIVTVNAKDMKYKTTITGTTLPRYIKQINANKAYVSEWGDSAADGAVRVMDLTTNTFTKRIIVGKGAEQILVYGNRAYVTCNGGFDNSDSIAIINIDKDSLIGKLAVGANPESIAQDADNNIWILCKGAYNSSFTALAKQASLVRYNTFTNTIDRNLQMPSIYTQATSLCMNPAKTKLYYLYENGLYFMNITETAVRAFPMVYNNFFAVNVDPKSGVIYTLDAKDFNSNGLLRRYNDDAIKIDSFSVGIIPSEFHFSK
jgi:hypothetical protein